MAGRQRIIPAMIGSAMLVVSCNQAPPPKPTAEPESTAAATAPCRQDPEEQHQLEEAAGRWVQQQRSPYFSKAEALRELCAFEHFEFLDAAALRRGAVIKAGDTRWDVKICGFDAARFGWIRIRTAPERAHPAPPLKALRVPHDAIDQCLDPHDVYFLEQAGATRDERRMEPGTEAWSGIVLWRQLAPSAPGKDDRQGSPPYGGSDDE